MEGACGHFFMESLLPQAWTCLAVPVAALPHGCSHQKRPGSRALLPSTISSRTPLQEPPSRLPPSVTSSLPPHLGQRLDEVRLGEKCLPQTLININNDSHIYLLQVFLIQAPVTLKKETIQITNFGLPWHNLGKHSLSHV